ncbi:MAG: SCO family protein [Pikeienuella sp.]
MPNTRTYALAATAAVAVGLSAGAWFALQPTSDDPFAPCRPGAVSVGGPSIGGPFDLVDHTGTPRTSAEIIDKPTLIYFGYTYCPDICPVDVAVMGQAVDVLAEQGVDVNSVFITIDPERDHGQTLKEFTEASHPDMVGLTGSDDKINAAKTAFRVYGEKASGDDPEYYLMDHTTFTYLMGPGPEFLEVFRRGVTAEEMAEKTACYANVLAS